MDDYKIEVIAQKVLNLTQNNRIKWVASSNTKDYFSYKIGYQEVAIFYTGVRYVFEVYDSNKYLLGSIYQDGYSGAFPISSNVGILGLTNIGTFAGSTIPIGNPQPNIMLKDLFEAAKRSVVDIDKNLDDLLKNLNSM